MHETTYSHLEAIYRNAMQRGYWIISCKEFFLHHKEYANKKVFINRIDIDLSLKKAVPIMDMLDNLCINATFFIRLHAPEYNPFSFEDYRIIRQMQGKGFEIGLHSEIMDCAKIWDMEPEECLNNDLETFRDMTDELVFGIASHGSGLTGVNNLDFWQGRKPIDYGVLYEAYDPLFFNHFYCSIGLAGWKCYKGGALVTGDNRCLCEHLEDEHRIIYFTLHPIKFYRWHCYE